MKRLSLTLLALIASCASAPAYADWEITLQQRNGGTSSWIQRIPNNTASGPGIFAMDAARQLRWAVVGSGLNYDASTLTLSAPAAAQPDWSLTSGPGSILNKPTIPAAQVSADWAAVAGVAQILNKPSLAAVATSGAYADLSGRPTIPAAQVNADWSAVSGVSAVLNKPVLFDGTWASLTGKPSFATVATSGAYSDLSGLPTLFDGTWASLSGKPAWAGAFNGGYASLTGIPTTFAPSAHTHPASDISDSTAVGRSVMTAADGAAARLAIGAGTSSFSGVYSALTGIPSTFAPAAHTHAAADIVSGTLADARIPTLAIGKTSGLQAALDAKFNTPTGSTAQYLRGDGSLATFPAIPAAYAIGAPTSRSVSLATAYQCTNTAVPCLVTITLSAQSSISLSGASNNEGQLTIGSTSAVATGTGTNVATYRNNLGGALVVGLSITSAQANTYTVALPAGWYFAVRQTAGAGLTVVSAFDQQTGN